MSLTAEPTGGAVAIQSSSGPTCRPTGRASARHPAASSVLVFGIGIWRNIRRQTQEPARQTASGPSREGRHGARRPATTPGADAAARDPPRRVRRRRDPEPPRARPTPNLAHRRRPPPRNARDPTEAPLARRPHRPRQRLPRLGHDRVAHPRLREGDRARRRHRRRRHPRAPTRSRSPTACRTPSTSSSPAAC